MHARRAFRAPRAPRAHVFRVPMKFYFRAQEIHITVLDVEVDIAGKLVLAWKRPSRPGSKQRQNG